MKIIYGDRRSGKTIELINMAHKRGGYIVCLNHNEAYRIAMVAEEMGLNINFPLSYSEFLLKQYNRMGIIEFYIDNVEMLIQVMSEVPIEAITLSKDEECIKHECDVCRKEFCKSDLTIYDGQLLCDDCEEEVKDMEMLMSDVG